MSPYEFNTKVIKPIECLKEGWELIKDQYWLFFAITLVGILIASVVPLGILLGPVFCGIYYCLFQKINGQPVKFEDLFKGFDYFKPSLIAALFLIIPMFIGLIIVVIMYLSMIAMQVAMMKQRNSNPEGLIVFMSIFGIVMCLFYLIIGTVHTLLLFAFPLIVEHNLSGVEAFKLSARAVMKNLGGVVLFLACEFILMMAGALICVGGYLVLPICFAGTLIAYRRVFPRAESQGFNNPPSPDAFQGAGNYN